MLDGWEVFSLSRKDKTIKGKNFSIKITKQTFSKSVNPIKRKSPGIPGKNKQGE